jgi:hypothetical protein
MAKIISSLVAFVIVFIPARLSYNQNQCNNLEARANDILNIIPEISYILRYDLGLPDVCYQFDGTATVVPNDKIFKANERMRVYEWELSYKIIPIIARSNNVKVAYENYASSLRSLKDLCRADENYSDTGFEKLSSEVNVYTAELAKAMGVTLAKCYR